MEKGRTKNFSMFVIIVRLVSINYVMDVQDNIIIVIDHIINVRKETMKELREQEKQNS